MIPVILAGGFGKRLWPLSQRVMPKQFLPILGNISLFQHAVISGLKISNGLRLIIMLNLEFEQLARSQLNNINIKNADIILEPISRNTAHAIVVASLHAKSINNNDNLLIMPADHFIDNIDQFIRSVNNIEKRGKSDKITLFGIKPLWAEINYGYIKYGDNIDINCNLFKVDKFIEKPSLEAAKELVQTEDILWNSGIFMFTAQKFLSEILHYHPEIYNLSHNAYINSVKSENIIYLNLSDTEQIADISIDNAILEKTSDLVVCAIDINWLDLGSWKTIIDMGNRDEDANVYHGSILSKECKKSYFYAQGRLVIALGIDNCIIIETNDVVLIASKEKVDSIKDLVQEVISPFPVKNIR